MYFFENIIHKKLYEIRLVMTLATLVKQIWWKLV